MPIDEVLLGEHEGLERAVEVAGESAGEIGVVHRRLQHASVGRRFSGRPRAPWRPPARACHGTVRRVPAGRARRSGLRDTPATLEHLPDRSRRQPVRGAGPTAPVTALSVTMASPVQSTPRSSNRMAAEPGVWPGVWTIRGCPGTSTTWPSAKRAGLRDDRRRERAVAREVPEQSIGESVPQGRPELDACCRARSAVACRRAARHGRPRGCGPAPVPRCGSDRPCRCGRHGRGSGGPPRCRRATCRCRAKPPRSSSQCRADAGVHERQAAGLLDEVAVDDELVHALDTGGHLHRPMVAATLRP